MAKTYKIKVYSLSEDCGDGSTRTEFFPTKKEMLESIFDKLKDNDIEPTLEEAEKAMDDDPYEYGTPDTETIKISVDSDVATLVDSFSVSGGS